MVQEFNSVWDAIEDNPATASSLRLQSQLMIEIIEYVQQSGLTRAAAAKKLGTPQPRLNDIMKGRIEKYTVDRLVNILSGVGYTVNINFITLPESI